MVKSIGFGVPSAKPSRVGRKDGKGSGPTSLVADRPRLPPKAPDATPPEAEMFETKQQSSPSVTRDDYDSKAKLATFDEFAGPLRLALRTEREAAQRSLEADDDPSAAERLDRVTRTENALVQRRDQIERGKVRVNKDEDEVDIHDVEVIDRSLMFRLKWSSDENLLPYPTGLVQPRFEVGHLLFLGLSPLDRAHDEDEGRSQRLAAFDAVQEQYKGELERQREMRRDKPGVDRPEGLAAVEEQLAMLQRERDIVGNGRGWFRTAQGLVDARVSGIERRTREGLEVVELILRPVRRGVEFRWDSGGECQADPPAVGTDCCTIL